MMIGRVLPTREPVLRITVRGPSGQMLELDALVDSGFTGLLALPSRAIEQLGLIYSGLAVGTLADASRVVARRFAAVADWTGVRVRLLCWNPKADRCSACRCSTAVVSHSTPGMTGR